MMDVEVSTIFQIVNDDMTGPEPMKWEPGSCHHSLSFWPKGGLYPLGQKEFLPWPCMAAGFAFGQGRMADLGMRVSAAEVSRWP